MKVFKHANGDKISNITEHIINLLMKNPNMEVHVGCDSQSSSRSTLYVTVIAFKYGYRGVSYVYHSERVPKIRDLFQRLWEEAKRSIETAEWLKQKINVPIEIDMDFNNDKHRKSHNLVASAKGWAQSLGYKVNIKPDNQIATRAADHHCRN